MRISTYKPLGQYRVASIKELNEVYRLLCFVEYYMFRFKWPFVKKVRGWTTLRKAYGSIVARKHGVFESIAKAEQVIGFLEEVRLRGDLGRWIIAKSIGALNELEGPRVTYDEEANHGYFYLTEKHIPVAFSIPSDDDLFVMDFDENDELIGIEFCSLQGLAKFINSNVHLSIRQRGETAQEAEETEM